MAVTDAPWVAAQLTALTGAPVTPLDDDAAGFRIKETPTHYIDVVPMIYNWRVIRVPKACPLTVDGAWCYYGTQINSLLRAVAAAVAWDGTGNPAGWDKNATTGEYAQRPA